MDKSEQKVRQYRVDRGVNQTEVAVTVGRSQSWYSMFENGLVTPGPETVEKIFKAIDVLAELQHKETKIQTSRASKRLAGLRLPSRLEIANRASAK